MSDEPETEDKTDVAIRATCNGENLARQLIQTGMERAEIIAMLGSAVAYVVQLSVVAKSDQGGRPAFVKGTIAMIGDLILAAEQAREENMQ